eukprot:11506813-Karenia_brevis.AAC.1
MLPYVSAETAVCLFQWLLHQLTFSHWARTCDASFSGHIDDGTHEMNDGVSHTPPQYSKDASHASPDLFDTNAPSDQSQLATACNYDARGNALPLA